MRVELSKEGLNVLQQKNIIVFYETDQVGEYFADLLVNELVIIELKAAENICEEQNMRLIAKLFTCYRQGSEFTFKFRERAKI